MSADLMRLAGGRESIRRLVWQELLAIVLAVTLLALLFVPVPPMVRFVAAIAFCVWTLGVAVLAITGGMFRTYHPGLVVSLGLAVMILLAEFALWAHAFYPRVELAIVCVAAIATIVVATGRDARSERRARQTATSQTQLGANTPMGGSRLGVARALPRWAARRHIVVTGTDPDAGDPSTAISTDPAAPSPEVSATDGAGDAGPTPIARYRFGVARGSHRWVAGRHIVMTGTDPEAGDPSTTISTDPAAPSPEVSATDRAGDAGPHEGTGEA
jgi:hypothetical protein